MHWRKVMKRCHLLHKHCQRAHLILVIVSSASLSSSLSSPYSSSFPLAILLHNHCQHSYQSLVLVKSLSFHSPVAILLLLLVAILLVTLSFSLESRCHLVILSLLNLDDGHGEWWCLLHTWTMYFLPFSTEKAWFAHTCDFDHDLDEDKDFYYECHINQFIL